MNNNPETLAGSLSEAGERAAIVQWLRKCAKEWRSMPIRYALKCPNPFVAMRVVLARFGVAAAFSFAAMCIERGDHLISASEIK